MLELRGIVSSQHNGKIEDFYSAQGQNLFLVRSLNDWEVESLCLSNIVLDHNKVAPSVGRDTQEDIFGSKFATLCWNITTRVTSQLWLGNSRMCRTTLGSIRSCCNAGTWRLMQEFSRDLEHYTLRPSGGPD
ncbi:hypothetical protein HAX54_025645 [Datura stramonium]|uniref:Uncharacterized protein n=1 Tax=Datura stramonium TaxID=4076 RepID=A0ABS8V103_DATST|nr:hypothetical protein [Datura stramonium]